MGWTRWEAYKFMHEKGTMFGNRYAISQSRLRDMQLSGELAEWVKGYEQSRAFAKRTFKTLVGRWRAE